MVQGVCFLFILMCMHLLFNPHPPSNNKSLWNLLFGKSKKKKKLRSVFSFFVAPTKMNLNTKQYLVPSPPRRPNHDRFGVDVAAGGFAFAGFGCCCCCFCGWGGGEGDVEASGCCESVGERGVCVSLSVAVHHAQPRSCSHSQWCFAGGFFGCSGRCVGAWLALFLKNSMYC